MIRSLILKACQTKLEIAQLTGQLEDKKKELSEIGDAVEKEFGYSEPIIVKVGTQYYTVYRDLNKQMAFEPTEVLE